MAESLPVHVDANPLTITCLPSVVVTEILSLLDWRDKLNAVTAVPEWRGIAQTPSAWPLVVHENEMEKNVYFVREARAALLMCIKRYGINMRHIRLTFANKIGRSGVHLLHAIADNCKTLRFLELSQDNHITFEQQWTWGQSSVKAFFSVLAQCPNDLQVALKHIYIDWSDKEDNNIVVRLYNCGYSEKISELHLTSISLLEHEGYMNLLKSFTNLTTLVVRRDKINKDILLTLVSKNLRELTLFQDEELSQKDSNELDNNFWKAVVSICPAFTLDLVLRYIMVIRDSFPENMPLRSLILDDLANIVTKGVMDQIQLNYHKTLDSFTYTNSFLDTCETGDKRMPYALVDLVYACQNLHSIQYGFPLSSTSVLLIARARKLRRFVIPSVEISYEFDWPVHENWSPEFVHWLKDSGKNDYTLENAVSELFGAEWRLSLDGQMLEETLAHFHL